MYYNKFQEVLQTYITKFHHGVSEKSLNSNYTIWALYKNSVNIFILVVWEHYLHLWEYLVII